MSKAFQKSESQDDIDCLIAVYGGDAKALIRVLLDERAMLLHEVEVAASAMSIGYSRGWKPKLPKD